MTVAVDDRAIGPVVTATTGATLEVAGRFRRWWRRSGRGVAVRGALYLALSVVMWWGLWSHDPRATTTCACGDSSLFQWFVNWPAYALGHGHNPFFSRMLFTPTGTDLLSNTSEPAIGILLAPLTWAFGVFFTLNVALTLTPVANALAMDYLLGRYVRSGIARLTGALLFGFSPFVITALDDEHFMTGMLFVLPLLVAALDHLLVRQTRPAWKVGLAIAGLLALQFFIGTEVLVIAVIVGTVVVALVAAVAFLVARRVFLERAPYALRGGLVAIGASAALLAYPTWFALAGPGHLPARVWPTWPPGLYGVRPSALVEVARNSPSSVSFLRAVGGYQGGPMPAPTYVGWIWLAVAAAGLLVFARDRRLWVFAGTAAVAVWCAEAPLPGTWTPWHVFAHLPVVDNALPIRFDIVAVLALAVMAAIVVDRMAGAATSGALRGPVVRRASSLAVAAALVVSLGWVLAPSLPLATQPVVAPKWFTKVAPRLAPSTVVMPYPPAFGGLEAAESWQVVGGMSFSMPGGAGPAPSAFASGSDAAGEHLLFSETSLWPRPPAAPSPGDVHALAASLSAWGVDLVVVPLDHNLPRYDVGKNLRGFVALMTEETGRAPVFQADALVWSTAPADPRWWPAGTVSRCVAGPVGAIPACLLASPSVPLGGTS